MKRIKSAVPYLVVNGLIVAVTYVLGNMLAPRLLAGWWLTSTYYTLAVVTAGRYIYESVNDGKKTLLGFTADVEYFVTFFTLWPIVLIVLSIDPVLNWIEAHTARQR